MSDVWLKHALRKFLKLAQDSGLNLQFMDPLPPPEPRYLVSMSFDNIYGKDEVWVRLPRWAAKILLWKWLRKAKAPP